MLLERESVLQRELIVLRAVWLVRAEAGLQQMLHALWKRCSRGTQAIAENVDRKSLGAFDAESAAESLPAPGGPRSSVSRPCACNHASCLQT